MFAELQPVCTCCCTCHDLYVVLQGTVVQVTGAAYLRNPMEQFHCAIRYFLYRTCPLVFFSGRAAFGGGRGALPDVFFLLSFPYPEEDHEQGWPPFTVVFPGWYPQYAECEEQKHWGTLFNTIKSFCFYSQCSRLNLFTTQKVWMRSDSTRYWNHLEDYWHCAGGLGSERHRYAIACVT